MKYYFNEESFLCSASKSFAVLVIVGWFYAPYCGERLGFYNTMWCVDRGGSRNSGKKAKALLCNWYIPEKICAKDIKICGLGMQASWLLTVSNISSFPLNASE